MLVLSLGKKCRPKFPIWYCLNVWLNSLNIFSSNPRCVCVHTVWQLVFNCHILQIGRWGIENVNALLTDTEFGEDSAAVNPCGYNLQATSPWFPLNCILRNTWSKNYNGNQGGCYKSDKVHKKGLRHQTLGTRESLKNLKSGNLTWLDSVARAQSTMNVIQRHKVTGLEPGTPSRPLEQRSAWGLWLGGGQVGERKEMKAGLWWGSTASTVFCWGSLWHNHGQIIRLDMRFSSTWYKGFVVFHFWRMPGTLINL